MVLVFNFCFGVLKTLVTDFGEFKDLHGGGDIICILSVFIKMVEWLENASFFEFSKKLTPEAPLDIIFFLTLPVFGLVICLGLGPNMLHISSWIRDTLLGVTNGEFKILFSSVSVIM